MLKKILILMSLVLFVAMGFLACSPGDNGDSGVDPVQAHTIKNSSGFGFYSTGGGLTPLSSPDSDFPIISLENITIGGNAVVYTSGALYDDDFESHRPFYAEGTTFYPQADNKFTTTAAIVAGVDPSKVKGKGVALVGGKTYLLSIGVRTGRSDFNAGIITTFDPDGSSDSKILVDKASDSVDIRDAVIITSGNKEKAFVIGVEEGSNKLYVWEVSKAAVDNPERAIGDPVNVNDLTTNNFAPGKMFITDAAAPGSGDLKYVSVMGYNDNDTLAGIVQLASTNAYHKVLENSNKDKFPYISSLISTGNNKVSYVLWEVSKDDDKWTPGEESKVYIDVDPRRDNNEPTDLSPFLTGSKNLIVALSNDGTNNYAVGINRDDEGEAIGLWTGTSGSQTRGLGTNPKLFEFDNTADYPKATFMTRMATMR